MASNPQNLTLLIQNQLNKASMAQQVSFSRLSSSKRINSAADDAAGLSLSSRLEAYSRGANFSQRNVSNAASYLQVADAALQTVNENLQTMRELAVQASSGTLSDSDRQNLNEKYQGLKAESLNILQSTQFNGRKVFLDEGRTLDVFLSSSSRSRFIADLSARRSGIQSSFYDAYNQAQAPSASTTLIDSTPGVVSASNVPVGGSYDILINALAHGLDLNDSVGPASTIYGNAAVGVPTGTSTTNSNPAVVSVNGTPSRGGYNIEVKSTASNQVNVLKNIKATYGAGGGASTESYNRFNIQFENGDAIDLVMGTNASGAFTTQDFVDAFNSTLAGRVVANYDAATQTLTYTGQVGESFSVDSQSFIKSSNSVGSKTILFAPNDELSTENGSFAKQASLNTGYVNGQFFSSATSTITSTFGGGSITFDVLSKGSSFVKREDNSSAYSVSNSNPSVAYQIGTTSAGTYDVNVTQVARGQRSVISGVSGRYGAYGPGTTPNTGTFYFIAVAKNPFKVQFADGSSFTFDIDTSSSESNAQPGQYTNSTTEEGGYFTAEKFISSLNAAAGGRVVASYDSSTSKVTIDGAEGAANAFTITSVYSAATSDATVNNAGDVAFNVDASNTVITAANATGTINGVAFNSASSSVSSSGLNFRALAVGSSTIKAGALGPSSPASNDSFTISFGDGTAARSFNLVGPYSVFDYISSFNSAGVGKVLASFNASTNMVEYRSLESGATKTYSVSSSRAIFNTTDATVVTAASDYSGSVNGSAFSQTGSTLAVGSASFQIIGKGSTTISFLSSTSTRSSSLDGIESASKAYGELRKLDQEIDLASSQRAVYGAYLSRLDRVMSSLSADLISSSAAYGRITDASSAAELSNYLRSQINLTVGAKLFRSVNELSALQVGRLTRALTP